MAKRGLGKGLDALFQTYENDEAIKNKEIQELPIQNIDPNPDQPRRVFSPESIDELAESILEHGVVQPILVKPLAGRHIIVAGERRWRASRLAGLETIPAIIMDISDRELLEIALIENLQREDLNPIEEAEGINSLIESYDLTQEEIAKRLGRSRPSISNTLRLLRLPDRAKSFLAENRISMGHARALLGLQNQDRLNPILDLILEKGLSVRETETLVKRHNDSTSQERKGTIIKKPSFIIDIESRLEESLGTKVTINHGKRKGLISIEYYNNDDLDRLIEKISRN